MSTEIIHWTALPNGIVGGKHRVSLVPSPRLSGGDKLDDFARWRDWPATVAAITDWGLKIGSGSQQAADTATGVTVIAPAVLRSDLWRQLFPPDTLVRPFQGLPETFAAPKILPFPETEMRNILLGEQILQARSLTPPSFDEQIKRYGKGILERELNSGATRAETQFRKLNNLMAKKGVAEAQTTAGIWAQAHFALSATVRGMGDAKISKRTVRNRAANRRAGTLYLGQTGAIEDFLPPLGYKRPKLDFAPPVLDLHQGVSALGSHPQLMRMLGLIIDLEFVPPAVHLGADHEAFVTAAPVIGGPVAKARLATRCLIGGATFKPKPRPANPELGDGLLLLEQDKYDFNQIDTEGGFMKTANFAAALEQRRTRPGLASIVAETVPERDLETLFPPTLRSTGLSVLRAKGGDELEKKLARQVAISSGLSKVNAGPGSVQLDQEDVTSGYIFDVYDSIAGAWYSLCRRIGNARFGPDPGAEPIPLKAEEGWVSASVTQGGDTEDEVLRTSDSLTRWLGWSLVVPRPGRRLRDDETIDDGAEELGNLKLAINYSPVPGSLPPLRFGREYMIRARAVDLAGNAIESTDADEFGTAHVLGPETYRRWEPVLPPTVIPRRPLSESESPDLLVIRSNPGVAPPTKDEREGSAANPQISERHIFPPSIDQFRAECHGSFDKAGGIDPAAYERIAARESGAYDERADNGAFVHTPAAPDPRDGTPYFDTDKPKFAVEGGAMAEMPALPDPLAEGYAFSGLPGTFSGDPDYTVAETYTAYPSMKWPDIRSLRLRAVGNETIFPPQLENDVLYVYIPKAEDYRIELSSSLAESRLKHLGIWSRLEAEGTAAGLRASVLDGRHWALTPSRSLRIVHAVRQPLLPTEFTSGLVLDRRAGENFVTLLDTLTTSRKSTERVEVTASWEDLRDVLERHPTDADKTIWVPEKKVPFSAPVFQRPIERDRTLDGELAIAERHDLHSTRHIPDIKYTTIATTRFKEYFTDRESLNFSSDKLSLESRYPGAGKGIVPDSETVKSQDGATTYAAGRDYAMDYGAGTITRLPSRREQRRGKTRVVRMPSLVNITFVVESITQTSDNPKLGSGARALSATRPDPPKVLYAIPTFKRQVVGNSSERRSQREPVGLRVYLDRPWWSSGAGELLGVVVWPPIGEEDRINPSPALQARITQRGQDPIWDSAPTDRFVRPAHFHAGDEDVAERGLVIENGLALAEVAGEQVAVVGHVVHPDEGRRLWYCDIDILPGSAYTPFIKLALVRYQPHSLSGLELSEVVPLSFMQLYPNRVASVSGPASGGSLTVTVSGRTYGVGGDVPAASVIEAHLEKRRPETPTGDDMVGWMAVDVAVDPTPLPSSAGSDGITIWRATMSGPSSGGRHRIVIKEYEQFAPTGGKTPDRRLVYAEAIEL